MEPVAGESDTEYCVPQQSGRQSAPCVCVCTGLVQVHDDLENTSLSPESMSAKGRFTTSPAAAWRRGELNEFTSDPVTGQGYPQLWVLTVHSKKKWEELNFSGCNFCAPRCNLKIKLAFRSAHMFLRSLVSMTLLLRRWPIPSLLTSFRATRPE